MNSVPGALWRVPLFKLYRRLVLAGGLQGVSLILKHILFLFPVWVLFWPQLGSWRKRVAYVVIAYGIFGLSFLPWMLDPPSRAGILQNVFQYRSEFTFSLSRLLASFSFLALVPRAESAVLTLGWIAVVIAAGRMVARGKDDLFPMYLLAMFAFSPALMDQYLALSLLVCAILYTSWPSWALTGTTILALFSSPYDIFRFPPNIVHYIAIVSTQLCATVMLLVQLRPASPSRTAPLTTYEAARNAVALAVGSIALVWVILQVKSFARL